MNEKANVRFRLGVLGYGSMTSAILYGICASSLYPPEDIALYTPSARSQRKAAEDIPGIRLSGSMESLCAQSDIIMLGMKPQDIAGVLRSVKEALKNKAVISIAAGTASSFLLERCGPDTRILRVMPNLAVKFSEGCTLFCEETSFLPEEKDAAERIFQSVGKVYWLKENLVDAGSVITGSAPAFTAVFVEALADGGVLEGLPRSLAEAFAIQMLLGSAAYLQNEKCCPGKLKDDVCSPGGSSIEGVNALELGAFRGTVIDAVRRTAEKCRKLAEA